MIPAIDSEWVARDGRLMRVEEIITRTDRETLAKLLVLNATRFMRRRTLMSVSNFGDNHISAFLRPKSEHET